MCWRPQETTQWFLSVMRYPSSTKPSVFPKTFYEREFITLILLVEKMRVRSKVTLPKVPRGVWAPSVRGLVVLSQRLPPLLDQALKPAAP